MPILLKTRVERTAKTPLPRRRTRVGGLCGFHGAAERVLAQHQKTGRCANVREHCGHGKRRKRTAAGEFWQREKPQAAKQDKAAASCATRGGHICPRCRQFWGFHAGVVERAKIAPLGSERQKAPLFQGKQRGHARELEEYWYGKQQDQVSALADAGV